MVAAAKIKADEQQILYDEDMFYDTDAGEFPVPPGDYHAPPTFVNGVKVINSYFELFAKFMLMDFTSNWMVQHTQQWGSQDQKMKENMSVVEHADKNVRTHANSMSSTELPATEDYIIANQFFATLTTDLKTAIADHYPDYFQNGARPTSQWDYATIFDMAVRIDISQSTNKI